MSIGHPLIHLATTTSTMDEVARRAAEGAAEGLVVVADEQKAGRGRAGRSWVAAPGTALLCSVLLRPALPPERLTTLSLVVGVAVAEAIEATTSLDCLLKWPNDILIDGRKVGGILIVSAIRSAEVAHVVVGIGVNVTTDERQLPLGAASLQSLGGEAPPIPTLLDRTLTELARGYHELLRSNGRPSLDAWRRRAALLGERVWVDEGEVRHAGTFAGVDVDGALLLRDDESAMRRIVAGDLTRGPHTTRERTGRRVGSAGQ